MGNKLSKKLLIDDLVERMSEYRNNKQYIFIHTILRYKVINDFLEEFIGCDEPSEYKLDQIKEIIICAKDIYELDYYALPLSDVIYDKVISKYLRYRDEPYSDNVSSGLTETPYKYDNLAGTLDKVHFVYNNERDKYETRESLEDFLSDLPIGKNDKLSVLINEKKDGTSVTIDFKLSNNKYKVNLATTRGNRSNDLGADVTKVFKYLEYDNIDEIYKAFGYLPEYIGVQFEFLVSNNQKCDFEKYIKRTFANNRSAASGLLRRLIFSKNKELKDLQKFISLVPVGYDILEKYKLKNNDYLTEYNAVLTTFLHGEIEMNQTFATGTIDNILKEFNRISNETESKRNKLNHAIDGLVLTILNDDLRNELGRKNSKNKFQIAYKFKEEGYKTKVKDLIVTYGNFGYVGLLLKVEPVILNGTVQEKAQIHSLDKFNKMNIRIGDEIVLKLSNDVIPFGYITDDCKRGNGNKLELPSHCDCGSELIEENNMLRCINPRCKHRIVGFLNTFLIEMGAKGIGDKLCEKLYEKLDVDDPIKLISLTYDDFIALDGVKNKSAANYEEIINKIVTEPKSPETILSSLCIDSFRKSTAKKVMDVISIEELLDKVMNGDVYEIASILSKSDGIADNAYKIAKGLIEKKDLLYRLLKLIPIKNKNIYYNTDKVLVVSGFRDDDEFIEVANKNGYEVKNSGKKFDLLVIANDSLLGKTKARTAIMNNIPIMTKKEFMDKYNL